MDTAVEARPEELYASVIAELLVGARNVAVGMLSPVPGAGALLAAHLSGGQTRLTILGSRAHSRFTNGGAELFDRAGRVHYPVRRQFEVPCRGAQVDAHPQVFGVPPQLGFALPSPEAL